MKKLFKTTFAVIVSAILFSSCTAIDRTIREPNTRLQLTKSDFTISEQHSGEATTVQIIGIDWARLFMKRAANSEGSGGISVSSIPIIGNFLADRTANYALYEILQANPGYDVALYPQYETKVIRPILGIGFLTKVTTVKATTRLGKLKQ